MNSDDVDYENEVFVGVRSKTVGSENVQFSRFIRNITIPKVGNTVFVNFTNSAGFIRCYYVSFDLNLNNLISDTVYIN